MQLHTMQLSSPAFKHLQDIPSQYTGEGEDIPPPLALAGVPAGTHSLALILDDPDAPGGDFTHWLVWNLPPSTTKILSGGLPLEAVEGLNDFGHQRYGGPYPPAGVHRYRFTLYALDAKLDLPGFTNKTALWHAMKPHILAQAVLVGLYERH